MTPETQKGGRRGVMYHKTWVINNSVVVMKTIDWLCSLLFSPRMSQMLICLIVCFILPPLGLHALDLFFFFFGAAAAAASPQGDLWSTSVLFLLCISRRVWVRVRISCHHTATESPGAGCFTSTIWQDQVRHSTLWESQRLPPHRVPSKDALHHLDRVLLPETEAISWCTNWANEGGRVEGSRS